jgi:hypothetical protein
MAATASPNPVRSNGKAHVVRRSGVFFQLIGKRVLVAGRSAGMRGQHLQQGYRLPSKSYIKFLFGAPGVR